MIKERVNRITPDIVLWATERELLAEDGWEFLDSWIGELGLSSFSRKLWGSLKFNGEILSFD